jgi:ribosomal protein L11 methyltransferase
MQYIQVIFAFKNIAEYQQDLLINDLAGIGFNTFEDTPNGFSAFTEQDDFQEASLKAVLADLSGDELEYSYEVKEIAGENWNEEWEKNFEPLIISDQCYVRATFHAPRPEYPFEIVIDPKMAFGTGHHQTTTMMMEYILSMNLAGKKVLDMGCGTGILAFLAAKKGATQLTAIDYDQICFDSTVENAALNNITDIEIICGGKEVIPDTVFDMILANINRNILLDQIERYAAVLKAGGEIVYSGFYETPDLDMIKAASSQVGMHYQDHKKINDWVAARFIKQ